MALLNQAQPRVAATHETYSEHASCDAAPLLAMRITAGTLRGRTMSVPDINGLRPTASRVRQALFNMLGSIEGLSILDLFAGSGVMGLEAISRGASSLHSIESNNQACQAMRQIQSAWSIQNWHIHQGKLPHALAATQHFDFIFADPPYATGIAEQIPAWLAQRQITYNTLVIEENTTSKLHWKQGFTPVKQRKYGKNTLYFFEPHKEQA